MCAMGTFSTGSRFSWRKWSSLMGSFLAFLPNGFSMYWGNLAVYVYSYVYVMQKVDPLQNQAPWLISLYLIARNVGVLSSTKLSQFLGRRLTMLLAVALFNGGLVSAFWAVRCSPWALNGALGVMTGAGNGLLHALVMVYVIHWSGRHVGFLTSAVMAAYNVGSALTNEAITAYVNPGNQHVDRGAGPVSYFSQAAILQAVPNVFLGLALFSASCHLTGCLLIKRFDPLRETTAEEDGVFVPEGQIPIPSLWEGGNYDNRKFVSSIGIQSSEEDREQMEPFLGGEKQNGNSSSVIMDEIHSEDETDVVDDGGDHIRLETLSIKQFEDKNKDMLSKTTFQNQNDSESQGASGEPASSERQDEEFRFAKDNVNNNQRYNPLYLFRTKEFYVLLVVMTTTDMASLVLTTYYKVFGQGWIDDDHFLTNLGTVLSVTTTTAKLLWGLVMDRCGVKTPTLLSITALTLVSSVYFFTPSISKWLFFFTTLLFGCSNSLVFTSFHVGTLRLLGQSHFATNYGVLSASTIGLKLVSPLVIEVIITRYGWLALFLGTSATAGLALIWVAIFMTSGV